MVSAEGRGIRGEAEGEGARDEGPDFKFELSEPAPRSR